MSGRPSTVACVPRLAATDHKALASLVRGAWSRSTSADPERWSEVNPAWGQCAVTALVVQDHLGGVLLRDEIEGVSHYWNGLPDGTELDLTIEQFGFVESSPTGEERSRAYVLSFPSTLKRYRQMQQRLRQDPTCEARAS